MGINDDFSRREFLRTSAVATAAVAIPSSVFAFGADQIKVGLIGCGGRGTGAIYDALNAEPSVVLYAMGDAFEDRLKGSRASVLKDFKDRCQVTDDRAFVGFDAYQKVLATNVDVVILATPPGFRPIHFAAAVDAGKHIFMEKPVATDAPGVRAVLAAAAKAKDKKLNVVTGTQRRHDPAYVEAMKRIADGQMGEVVATYVYWNQGGLWMNPRQDAWTDMEWQLRNWLYFTWLSGDHICEQHIHNLDVGNWAMGGKHPVKALSLAGRQVRTDASYGHIFDHFATEYEYDNGAKMMSMCRQIDGTASRVSEFIVGTKGTSNANTFIKSDKPWKWEGNRPNPYVEEHRDLYSAIKSGRYVNEAARTAESTLTAIMGRMSAYTGQEVTWDQALNSQESLIPKHVEMGHLGVPPVAVPGQTKLI